MDGNTESQDQVQIEEYIEDVSDVDNDSATDAVEAEASAAGWKKEGALSAAEFLEHKEVLSSKERNKRLIKESEESKQRLDEVTKRLERQEKAAEEYREFQAAAHKRELDRLKSESDALIAGLKQQRAEAIRNGDGEAVNDLDDRIDAAKLRVKEADVVAKPATEEPKTVVEDAKPEAFHADWEPWVAENAWFTDDVEMREIAEGIAVAMKRGGDKSEGRVFFDKVKERVRKVFPDKFGNPNRNKPGAVETSNTPPAFKGKTIADLPDVARAQMKDFISAGVYAKEAKKLGVTQESLYLKEYFS